MHAKKKKLETKFENEKKEMMEQIGHQSKGMKFPLFEFIKST